MDFHNENPQSVIQYKDSILYLTDEDKIFNKSLRKIIEPPENDIIGYHPETADEIYYSEVLKYCLSKRGNAATSKHPTEVVPQTKAKSIQELLNSGMVSMGSKTPTQAAQILTKTADNAIQPVPQSAEIVSHDVPQNHDSVPQSKNKGKSNGKFSGYFIVNGIRYESSRLAAKATGINYKAIQRNCKANKDGFKFVPK